MVGKINISSQAALSFWKLKVEPAERAAAENEKRRREERRAAEAATKLPAVLRANAVCLEYKEKKQQQQERLRERMREDERKNQSVCGERSEGKKSTRHKPKGRGKRTKEEKRKRKKTRRLAKEQQKASQRRRRAEQKRHTAREKKKKVRLAKEKAEADRLEAEKRAKKAKLDAAAAEQAALDARIRNDERKKKAEEQRKKHDKARIKQELATQRRKHATETCSISFARLTDAQEAQHLDADSSGAQSRAAEAVANDREAKKQRRLDALKLFASSWEPIVPKPCHNVKHQVSKLLEAKVIQNVMDDQHGYFRESFAGLIYTCYHETFGLQNMAEKKIQELVEGVRAHSSRDQLIELFGWISGMVQHAEDRIEPVQSIRSADYTCDVVLDFLGQLIPNHKAINELLVPLDRELLVPTKIPNVCPAVDEEVDDKHLKSVHDVTLAWSAGDALRERHISLDLLADVKEAVQSRLQTPSPVKIEDCIFIIFECWCSVMEHAPSGQLVEATPELRRDALRQIIEKEVTAAGAVDEMTLLKDRHKKAVEQLKDEQELCNSAKMDVDQATAELTGLDEASLVLNQAECDRLKYEAQKRAAEAKLAEQRAERLAEQAREIERQLAEADKEESEAERQCDEALFAEYEAIDRMDENEKEQQREKSKEQQNELDAAREEEHLKKQRAAKEAKEAKEAELQYEKEKADVEQAHSDFDKEQKEAEEATKIAKKEAEEARIAENNAKVQESKVKNAQEEVQNQLSLLKRAMRARKKTQNTLESERKDAKNAAFSRRSKTQRDKAMAAALEADEDAEATVKREQAVYERLNAAAEQEEITLLELRKIAKKELDEADQAQAVQLKEQREAEQAKLKLDIEEAEKQAAQAAYAHEQAEADQAQKELEEVKNNNTIRLKEKMRNAVVQIKDQNRRKKEKRDEAERKIQDAKRQGEELLKNELIRHKMDERTYDEVRERVQAWKDRNPQIHADEMDLIAAWVYSMGPGGMKPNYCECGFHSINGPPPWNKATEGTCTCPNTPTNFRIYDELNRSMRGIKIIGRAEPRFEWLHYHLTNACEHIPGMEPGQHLYRGQPKLYGVEYAIDDVIRWNDYKSTSTNPSAAEEFAGQTGIRITIVDVPHTIGACFNTDPPLSAWPNEEEILLPAGATFRVQSHNRNGCRCRDKSRRSRNQAEMHREQASDHDKPHEIVLRYEGQWYDDLNPSGRPQDGISQVFTACCRGLCTAVQPRYRKAVSECYQPANTSKVPECAETATHAVPTSQTLQPTAAVTATESHSQPEPQPDPQLLRSQVVERPSTPVASPPAPKLNIYDQAKRAQMEKKELENMKKYDPLRYELVVQPTLQTPRMKLLSHDEYDFIEDKMERWLSAAYRGTMKTADAIAASIWTMGSATDSVDCTGGRVRETFNSKLFNATKTGRRSTKFDEEFGRMHKHLKNAVVNAPGAPESLGGDEFFLGYTAQEYSEQTRQGGDSYTKDSQVTWLDFRSTTTEKAVAAEKAGDGGLVIKILGLTENCAANFAKVGLGKRCDHHDVVLRPGITFAVERKQGPVPRKNRLYTLVTLRFKALDVARQEIESSDSDSESESLSSLASDESGDEGLSENERVPTEDQADFLLPGVPARQ